MTRESNSDNEPRNVAVRTVPATATASAPSPSILITSYLLLDWLDIAIRHEHEAMLARKQDDGSRERQEAMIAVSASAHAVDGLARQLEHELDEEEVERVAGLERKADGARRAGHVNAVLMLAVPVSRDRWRQGLIRLIKTLRDPAVHPKAMAKPPVPHPDTAREANVSAESALYSLEGATRSVDLVCEIFASVIGSTESASKAVAGEIAPRVEQLLAERKRLLASPDDAPS
jgi:hypothetical protein